MKNFIPIWMRQDVMDAAKAAHDINNHALRHQIQATLTRDDREHFNHEASVARVEMSAVVDASTAESTLVAPIPPRATR